jgi:hypothetical protein
MVRENGTLGKAAFRKRFDYTNVGTFKSSPSAIKVKVKQSHYRPGQALRFPEG